MLNDTTTKDENSEVAMCARLLEASPPIPPSIAKVEPLKDENKPSSDEAKAPEVELKPFPSSSRCEYLGPNSTYPVILIVSLNASQIDFLLGALREHRKAIRYTLDDLKCIHPSLCMH